MNQQESHEMVGELLDALNQDRLDGRQPTAIVMLGDAWAGLMADVSAMQFIVAAPIGQPYTFQQIPLKSSNADGPHKFRLEY